MPAGRPTKYTPELIEKAWDYLDNYESYQDVIPSIVGLSVVLEISQDTAHEWKKHEDKKEFSDILRRIISKQHSVLINKGLTGTFNSAIAKLVLGKHGYHEKTQQENTGKDGGPIRQKWEIEIIKSDK